MYKIIRMLAIAALLIGPRVSAAECKRIVTLAPSIAETTHVLGLTPRIVAVSQFTQYPQALSRLPQVGGLLDLNIEAITAMKPSLVIGLEEQRPALDKLNAIGLPVLTVDQRRTAGIFQSMQRIAGRCDLGNRAEVVSTTLRSGIQRLKSEWAGRAPVPTLVVVTGKSEAYILDRVYVSGRDGFYSDLLEMAGGRNVYAGDTGTFSAISAEQLIRLAPEAIVEVLFDAGAEIDPSAVAAVWDKFPTLPAVRNKRILVLNHYEDTIPGPRFLLTAERIQRFLHPADPR